MLAGDDGKPLENGEQLVSAQSTVALSMATVPTPRLALQYVLTVRAGQDQTASSILEHSCRLIICRFVLQLARC